MRKAYLIAGISFQLLLLATFVGYGLTANVPPAVHVALRLGGIFWIGFLWVSLVYVLVVAKEERYAYLFVFILHLITGGLCYLCIGSHIKKRQKWFLETGKPVYELAVREVLKDKANLSDRPKAFHDLHKGSLVIAETNTDGSVYIRFHGRDGSMRHGYLYHSGSVLNANTMNPKAYFVHLTNGWYEF